MAGRNAGEVSKYRLDSYKTPSRPATSVLTWQQFRTSYRSSDLPVQLSPRRSSPRALSPRSDFLRPARTSTGRAQSPLQKYRSNPDLFYQALSGQRGTSPGASGFCSGLTTGLLRTRNEVSVTNPSGVLKRRLSDVLRTEDLQKAQEILAEMTNEDVRRLPPHYLEELMKTLALLDRKIRPS